MVKSLDSSQVKQAIDTLVLGFSADPFMRWLYPDAADYLQAFPKTIQLFAGAGFDLNAGYLSADHRTSAVWLPPGAHPDEDGLGALFEAKVAPEKHEDLFAAFAQMDALHPKDPCWHLAFIAVDPAARGQGAGAALLTENLKVCDASGIQAYLENTNPANTGFYQRHGFEVVGEMQSGKSPPMFAMSRPPQ